VGLKHLRNSFGIPERPSQLSSVERQKIEQWGAAHGTPQQVALRCRIVLGAAAGESDVALAKRLSVNRNTVILWRERFSDKGLDGLWDIAPGRGRKPTYSIDKITASQPARNRELDRTADVRHGNFRLHRHSGH
jgi:hypothetical protein